jgi:hypothetical protein
MQQLSHLHEPDALSLEEPGRIGVPAVLHLPARNYVRRKLWADWHRGQFCLCRRRPL